MEKLTLDKAYDLCTFARQVSADHQSEHQKKIRHLWETLSIGYAIATEKTDELGCALLLHDIGSLAFPGQPDHAETGHRFLLERGVEQPEILLPVRYHENDMDWEEKLAGDALYLNSACELQQKIRLYCQIVREADILAHMEDLSTIRSTREAVNPVLFRHLAAHEIAHSSEVRTNADRLIYILCGLPLIKRRESWRFLRDTGLVHQLCENFCRISTDIRFDTDKLVSLAFACAPLENQTEIDDNRMAASCERSIQVCPSLPTTPCAVPPSWIERNRVQIALLKELICPPDLPILKGSLAQVLYTGKLLQTPGDLDLCLPLNHSGDSLKRLTEKLRQTRYFDSARFVEGLPADCAVWEYAYPSTVSGGVEHICIEMTFLADTRYTQDVLVESFVRDDDPAFPENSPFSVRTVSPQWLYLDKLFSMLDTAMLPDDSRRKAKISRQLNDLYALSALQPVRDLVNDEDDLLQLIFCRLADERHHLLPVKWLTETRCPTELNSFVNEAISCFKPIQIADRQGAVTSITRGDIMNAWVDARKLIAQIYELLYEGY